MMYPFDSSTRAPAASGATGLAADFGASPAAGGAAAEGVGLSPAGALPVVTFPVYTRTARLAVPAASSRHKAQGNQPVRPAPRGSSTAEGRRSDSTRSRSVADDSSTSDMTAPSRGRMRSAIGTTRSRGNFGRTADEPAQ